MLEVFTTSKYDNKIAVINGEKSYTFFDLKGLIAKRMQQLREVKDNVVIIGGDNFSFIINFFASIFTNKTIYLVTDKNRLNELDFEYYLLGNINENTTATFIAPQINPNDIVIKFFTSGSSGRAKTINKSLFNLIEEGCDLCEEFKIKDDLRVISTTTMAHLFGMTFHLMFSLCNGFIIDTTPISYPENVNMENTILVSTPAFLSTKVKHKLDFEIPPEYIISAGSKLDENVFEELEKKSNIIEIYGSTETGVIAYKTKHDENFCVFSNVNIKVNEENVEIQSNYTYGGKTVINDKLELDGKSLTIKSRTDRLFKIYDKRVSAEELEEKLNSHDYVESSYIINHDNKLACLCVLTEKGKEFLLEHNIYPLTKELKLFMLSFSEVIPQKWKFIDKIPMNKMGKIDKKLIEHIFNVNISLPVILERKQENESITYKIFMYKSCNFFNGHFPEYKLVPGVLQLYLAKEFANIHFGLNLGEGQYKRIKFCNIIPPDSILNLKLKKTEKQVCYEFYSDEQRFSSGAFDIYNIFNGEENVLV